MAGPKQILVLHSYHKGFLWTDNIQKGIESVLGANDDIQPEIYVQYMDTKRFAPQRVFPRLKALYAEIFSRPRPDAILTSDDNALDFILTHGDELFPGTPVVFCGANNFRDERLAGHQNYTGVVEDYDLRSTLALALVLHPEARHVAVVTDSTSTGTINLKRFRAVFPEFDHRAEAIELFNLTTPELQTALAGLPPDSVILNLSFFRDRDGTSYSTEQGNRIITGNTDRPIYSCWDFYLGTGIVGGRLVSGFLQGAEAMSMVMDILRGTPVADIPILRESPNKYMFDYGPMAAAGLRTNDLPEDSEIVNYPLTFYDRHKGKFWSGLAILATLIMLIVAMGFNILRRKQAEAELQLAVDELQSILDNSQVGIMHLRGGRIIRKANQRLADILGYESPEELAGLSVSALHASEEAHEKFGEQFYNPLVNGRKLHVEYQISRKDKSRIWVSLSGKATDATVPPDLDKGVIWIMDDISERKRVEEALRSARNYIRNIIDSMPSILVGVDDAGHVTQWNAAAHRATGIRPEDVLGRLLGEVLPSLNMNMDDIRRAVQGGTPCSFHGLKTSMGDETVYNDVTVYPLVGDEKRGAVILVDDVSERVRMEEMMVQSEKMMSVGGLAAGMAHEINNPLGGILGAVQNTLKRVSPEFDRNRDMAAELDLDIKTVHTYLERRGILHFLEGIRDSGMRAAEIVRHMLDFSRASSRDKAPGDLCAILDTTVNLASKDYNLKTDYDFKDITINREYEAGLPLISIIASEIEQVFLNLLINAAQAMSENKDTQRQAAMTLRVLREEGFLRVEIQDSGPGMDARARKRIFEPFYTTKSPGKGTGLGLSVSYFIVTRNHGGTLAVESNSSQGATFIVRLPLT